MTIHPSTGPELFLEVGLELDSAFNDTEAGIVEKRLAVASAQVSATQAQTAAIVMLTEVIANAKGAGHYDLDAWREVIPKVPLKECREDARRPQCAERHTEDCPYVDPPVEPKHKLLPVGTRVLVQPLVIKHLDGRVEYPGQPFPAKISGHTHMRDKYEIHKEYAPGQYHSYTQWAFADNRVQAHPDGPECPPAPQPVTREPTAPRVYVQRADGSQGYLLEVRGDSPNTRQVKVQWFTTSGQVARWGSGHSLEMIPAERVARCLNGQTIDACSTGDDQCEPCLQAEDEEGDMIEESMGLR